MNLIIKNGRVINPATETDTVRDVYVAGNRIVKDMPADALEIDASGKWVMPGFVDLHVHFRDPGLTYKEDISTGSAAAARGGVTTVCAMPNTKPVVDSVETLAYIQGKVQEAGLCNVRQLSAITMDMEGNVLVPMREMWGQGAVAFSEDGKSVMDVRLYMEAMKTAAQLDALVMAHCEDKNLVGNGVLNAGRIAEKYGVPGIYNAVEDIITARDIFLAGETGCRLHLCHCSTKGSVELVRMAKRMGIDVTAEVCPHHFTLTDEDITEADSNYKMNPPLRSREDVNALIEGLADDTMEMISTDHAPHGTEEKAQFFDKAPFGIIGLETSASLTYTALVKPGHLTPMQMAEKMSYNPARRIGETARGDLSAGKLADIVIFDPQAQYVVNPELFASKGKNTPYKGRTLQGQVKLTILEGRVVYGADWIEK
ncbi:MAG: dihydroorotase [Lachnospiraceae bacterium]|nr:dihydroorotase [Lachnospiraceae bacterium]